MEDFFAAGAVGQSDIDIFIYGLPPVFAEAKMRQIVRALECAGSENNVAIRILERRTGSVTVQSPWPNRPVQIVLKINLTAASVVHDFDLASCCFLYDGTAVYGSFRGLQSIIFSANVVDLQTRSVRYEDRLLKYALRGYSVAIPGLLLTRDVISRFRDALSTTTMMHDAAKWKGFERLLAIAVMHLIGDQSALDEMMQQRAVRMEDNRRNNETIR